MADPKHYTRGYSFTNYQADVPDQPLPGNRLDVELDNIAEASSELTARVNAGIDVSINNEALEAVGAEIGRVVFVADNMDTVREVADLGPNLELAVDLFLGAFANDPATTGDGDPLKVGATYYNTRIGESRVWAGPASGWIPVAKVSTGGVLQGGVTASGGQKEYLVGDYVSIMLARNGLVLEPGTDFTMTSPTVTVPAVQDGDRLAWFAILKGTQTDAASFVRRAVLTTAGRKTYALSADGSPLNLTQTNHVLFGGSPFGMLTYGVDYTVADGALVLDFSPSDGELFHIFSMPRFTNSEAQVILQDFREEVADTLAVTPRHFATRAAAQVAIVGVQMQFITVAGLHYVRDPEGTALTTAGGVRWSPLGDVTPEHFGDITGRDAAPFIRAAIAFAAARGGGVVRLGPREYRLETNETRTVVSVSATEYNPTLQAPYCVFVPYGVSLIGVPGKTKLRTLSSGGGGALALIDWGKARISGIEIHGKGATVEAQHGIGFVATSQDYIAADFELSSLHIHDVASYGIGYQYGLPLRATLRDIVIEDTGSDGIDWKVRGSSVNATFAEGVVFDNIEVRRFGKRLTGASSTGLGLRGPFLANNIRVYEIGGGQVGIGIMPGIATTFNNDYRISAHRSVLTNWYCEGARRVAASPTVGVDVFAAGSVEIGEGVAHRCIITTSPVSATPYDTLHGPRIRATVIPPVNVDAVLLRIPGATVDVAVQSDHDMYSPKANNASVGQRNFSAPPGHGQYAKVVKNQATLVEGADYTRTGDNFVLTAGLAANDALFLVYPPLRAVRVAANYQNITGHADRWAGGGVSYAEQENVNTSSALGFLWDGAAGRLAPVNNAAFPGLAAAGPGDVPLRLTGAGWGPVEVSRPMFINLPTSAAGRPSGTLWRDADVLKIVP